MAKGLKAFRSKGVKILAWTSFGAALVGGPLVAGMFVGHAISSVLRAIPWGWIPPVLLGVLFVIFIRDMVMDWEPNKQAIWSLLVMPSVASATFGKLGYKVGEWSSSALALVSGPLREWLGTASAVALALFVAATAVLLAQRSIKGRAGKGAVLPDGV